MSIHHQLAAYSPITLRAVLSSIPAAFGVGADPRRELATLVGREYGADRVILCGSGTQALQLAIQIAARAYPANAPVALPAFNCFDVASAAVGGGLAIALYDIDPTTLAPDLASFERTLAAGAKVAVVATLYGVPFDWKPLQAIAVANGTALIEDAAQSHGASWAGRPLGTMGDISTLSFGRGKGWTGGGGGAVLLRGAIAANVTDEPPSPGWRAELKGVVALLAQWTLGRPSVYGLPRSIPGLELGVTAYHPPRSPVSMTRVAARAVLANRDASMAEGRGRREVARAIRAGLPTPTAMTVRVPEGADAGYLRFPVLATRASERMESHPSARGLGLERSYPCTLGELEVVQRRLVGPDLAWPGAVRLAEELITVPTHSLLSGAERAAVANILCDLRD